MSPVTRVTAIAVAVVGVLLALVWWLPTPGDESIRLLEDDHDRHVYFMRGSFQPLHAVPYLEVHSEYPEVATWFCAIPYLFMDAPADPKAYEGKPPPGLFERYANLYSTTMAICLVLLVLVSAKLCEHFRRDPRWALVMLLPSSVFFGFSRYDALPVLIVSASLLSLVKGRPLLAIFLVSIGVLTKWYAILFLPFYLRYIAVGLKRPWIPALAVSAATAALIVGTTFISGSLRYAEIMQEPGAKVRIANLPAAELPAAIATAVEKLPEGMRDFATGGIRAALTPYLKQGGRISNPGGLYQQISQKWFDIESGSVIEAKILRILAILQFCIMLLAFVRIESPLQLARFMCLATAFFVLFAKFYSPQWVMWTNALALLFMRNRLLIGVSIALDLFIWTQFSIIRGTSLRGTRNPDGTFALTEFWYHLYDVRIALTALFTLLVAVAILRDRKDDPEFSPA